jgi:cellulose synthase operon protein C
MCLPPLLFPSLKVAPVMKRLNVKLLIIVLVTVVVLAIGVVSVHAIQANRNVGNLLELAKEAEQAGDLRQTLSFYSRYLQYQPNDGEQLANFAILSLKLAESPDGTQNDLKNAYAWLSDAVQKLQGRGDSAKFNEVREKLVDLQMKVGATAAAKDHLQKMKAANTAAKKDDPMVDLRLAKCQTRTAYFLEAVALLEPLVGYDRATKTFDPAKAKAPKEIEAYALLAAVLRGRITDAQMPDRLKLADQVMEQLATMNPDDPKAILARAQDVLERSPDDAQSLVDRALKVAPNNADAILMAALLAINKKDLGKAETLLRHGIKENPKDSRLYTNLFTTVMNQNRYDDAEVIVRDGLNKVPNDPDLLRSRFGLQLVRKDFVGARNTLKLLDNTQVPPAVREFLECRLLLEKRDFPEVARRLQALRPKLVGNDQFQRQTDMMLVEAYNAMGMHDMAKPIIDGLESKYLNVPLSKLQVLLSQGKQDEALQECEELADRLASDPKRLVQTPGIWRPLYELRVSQLMRQPKEARNWQKVDSLLKLLREHDGVAEPAMSLLEVDVLIRKGEDQQAQHKLDELAKQNSSDPAVIASIARIATQKGDTEKARKVLDQMDPKLRSDPALISVQVECIAASKGTTEEKVEQLAKFGELAMKFPDDSRLQAYSSLGVAMIQLGNLAEALRWFDKVTELRPDDVRYRWMKFDLARGIPDQAAMKEIGNWYSSKFGPENEHAKLIEAIQLVTAVREAYRQRVAPNQTEVALESADREALKKARRFLNDVKNQRPGWHEIPKLLAEIDILENQYDEAITNLQEALTLGPANGRMINQLVQLLYHGNRVDEAKEVLSKYSAFVGEDLKKLNDYVNIQSGNSKISDEEVERLSKSTNVSDQLYLAHLLVGAGKVADAEIAYRKAISLSPDSPEVWLALIGHLWKQKKGLEAHEVVQEAQILLPEDRRALTLAQGYEVLGDNGQSDQFYLAALEAAPDDMAIQRAVATHYTRTDRVAKARPHLSKMISAPPPAGAQSEHYAWARRESAKLLAGEQDYRQFQKAMEMLKPAKGKTPDPQDLSLMAALLSQRGDVLSARQGLNLLATLEQQRPLVTLERMLRAQLNERLGKWSEASQEMTTLVSQAKPTPVVYVAFVEMLLRNGDTSGASTWLKSLKNVAPETPEIIPLTVRLEAAQGRGAQSAANLMKSLPNKRPLPKEEWPRLLAIAGLLEQIEQYDEAEKLLREYVGYAPQEALLLAKFLSDRGKVDETIALVEQMRKGFPASPLLQVLLMAVRQNVVPPTQDQVNRIEAIFERALRDDPESSLVQMQYGGLKEFQRRYEEAEKLYRQVHARLETRPRDRAIVANNLAYLLAIQAKQPEDALKFANEAIAFVGPDSDILDTRGIIYLAQGRTKEAVVDLTDAIAGPNPNPTKLVHLALAQAADKNEAGARESLKRAKELKFNPEDLAPSERTKYEALLRQLGQQT